MGKTRKPDGYNTWIPCPSNTDDPSLTPGDKYGLTAYDYKEAREEYYKNNPTKSPKKNSKSKPDKIEPKQ